MGICDACATYMRENCLTTIEMFLYHIRRLLDAIREKYPDIQLIMWDDMLRNCTSELLQSTFAILLSILMKTFNLFEI
jgi:hypothetical protein